MSKKERQAVWLYPKTRQLIKEHYQNDNCRSESEFIEKAVKFYTGYLDSNSGCATEYMATVLTSIIEAIIKGTENRMNRNLFKLAVETDMIAQLIAAGSQISSETLARLRSMCVENVRRLNGSISVEEAVRYQQEDN